MQLFFSNSRAFTASARQRFVGTLLKAFVAHSPQARRAEKRGAVYGRIMYE